MSILQLRIEAPAAGKEASAYLDIEFLRSTSSLLQNVQQLAWDLLPGAAEIKATYTDDEGDMCTLTERTADDALSFAVPAADGMKALKVVVYGAQSSEVGDSTAPNVCALLNSQHGPICEKKQIAAPQESAPTAEPQPETVEVQEDRNSGTVHAGFECNGCAQNPIIGQRFHSLEWDDFDLCKACHDHSDRVGLLGVLPGHEFAIIGQPVEAATTEIPVEMTKEASEEEAPAEDGVENCGEEKNMKCQEEEKEVEDVKRQLQQANNAREEAEQAKLQAQHLVEDLRQIALDLRTAAEEERNAKQEAVLAKETAQKALAEGMQQAREQSMTNETELRFARSTIATLQQEISELRDQVADAVGRASEAEKAVQAATQEASELKPGLSASIQSCSPLTLGIEAQEDTAAVGDFTCDFAELMSKFDAKQAFRFGRVQLHEAVSSPACSRVTVQNSGTTPWPQTTIVVNVEGDDMGMPVMALGALEPGEAAEIEMDLEVRLDPQAHSYTRSVWAITDAATGMRLGPLLVFEAAAGAL